MNTFFNRLVASLILRSSQFAGIFTLAMFLGGQNVRQEFYRMSTDLMHVSSREEFAEWMVRSQFRIIDLTKVDWKPISVFPKEASLFK